jgi:hypothetical protein
VWLGDQCLGGQLVSCYCKADANVVDVLDRQPPSAGDVVALSGLVAGDQRRIERRTSCTAAFGACIAQPTEPGGGEPADRLITSPGALTTGLGCSTHTSRPPSTEWHRCPAFNRWVSEPRRAAMAP